MNLIRIKTHRNNINKSRLSRILEADEGQFHLLLPEETLNPGEKSLDVSVHFYNYFF